MTLSPSGQFLVLVYSDGEILMTEDNSNYQSCLMQLEQAWTNNECYKGLEFLQEQWPATFSFRVISTHSMTQLRLSQIEQNKILTLVEYQVETMINGFKIHPSKDYLIVLTQVGEIYIFSVFTGEIRGIIKSQKYVFGLQLDPSGLYLACTIKTGKEILIYEIGSGKFAFSVQIFSKVQDPKAFCFSKDGTILSVGMQEGQIGFWQLPQPVSMNIKTVQNQMKKNPDFWQNYPIYYDLQEKYQLQEEDEEAVSQQRTPSINVTENQQDLDIEKLREKYSRGGQYQNSVSQASGTSRIKPDPSDIDSYCVSSQKENEAQVEEVEEMYNDIQDFEDHQLRKSQRPMQQFIQIL